MKKISETLLNFRITNKFIQMKKNARKYMKVLNENRRMVAQNFGMTVLRNLFLFGTIFFILAQKVPVLFLIFGALMFFVYELLSFLNVYSCIYNKTEKAEKWSVPLLLKENLSFVFLGIFLGIFWIFFIFSFVLGLENVFLSIKTNGAEGVNPAFIFIFLMVFVGFLSAALVIFRFSLYNRITKNGHKIIMNKMTYYDFWKFYMITLYSSIFLGVILVLLFGLLGFGVFSVGISMVGYSLMYSIFQDVMRVKIICSRAGKAGTSQGRKTKEKELKEAKKFSIENIFGIRF